MPIGAARLRGKLLFVHAVSVRGRAPCRRPVIGMKTRPSGWVLGADFGATRPAPRGFTACPAPLKHPGYG